MVSKSVKYDVHKPTHFNFLKFQFC